MKHKEDVVRMIGIVLILVGVAGVEVSANDFQQVETETTGGQDFVFPDDAIAGTPTIFALAMGETQENGERQQEQLLEWHQILASGTMLPSGTRIYHFPVIESPPFFVRGLIRRGIRGVFEDIVPESQAAVLFVDSTAEFARSAGITRDGRPTLVVMAGDGSIVGVVKGAPNQLRRNEVLELLERAASM